MEKKNWKKIFFLLYLLSGVRGNVDGWGTVLQAIKFRVRGHWSFFSLHNSYSRAMGLGFTQPEMTTRSFGGKASPVRKACNLTAICEPTVWTIRVFHNPIGLHD
jgi:hypothetical protein